MSIDISPVKIEGYEGQDIVFSITMFDEACAEVEIRTLVSVGSWPEISAAILKSLKMMKLEGGK